MNIDILADVSAESIANCVAQWDNELELAELLHELTIEIEVHQAAKALVDHYEDWDGDVATMIKHYRGVADTMEEILKARESGA